MKNTKQNGKITEFDVIGTRKDRDIRIKGTVENRFDVSGSWYKGNLHNHLARPGKQEWTAVAVDAYRQEGYDFVAGMDHDHIVRVEEKPDCLVIQAAEISCGGHLLAYGIDEIPPTKTTGSRTETIGDMIGKIKKQGGVSVLAHPFKSGYTYEELQKIAAAGLDGIEVINSNVRGKGADTSHSDQLWHMLLRDGYDLLALGNDDAHGPREKLSLCGEGFVPQTAWTGVLAKEYTHAGILDALRQKRTYATQGPAFYGITMQEAGRLIVKCSPCVACHIRATGTGLGGAGCYPDEKQCTSETFTFDFATHGYRVQDAITIVLQDVHGRRAYSSPLRVCIEYMML